MRILGTALCLLGLYTTDAFELKISSPFEEIISSAANGTFNDVLLKALNKYNLDLTEVISNVANVTKAGIIELLPTVELSQIITQAIVDVVKEVVNNSSPLPIKQLIDGANIPVLPPIDEKKDELDSESLTDIPGISTRPANLLESSESIESSIKDLLTALITDSLKAQ